MSPVHAPFSSAAAPGLARTTASVVLLHPPGAERERLLQRLLHASLPVVAELDNCAAGTQWFERHRCSVLLTAGELSDGEPLPLIAALAADGGGCRVLVVARGDVDPSAWRCIEAGASGQVSRDASPQELAQSVEAARHGLAHLPPAVVRQLLDQYRDLRRRSGDTGFTPRARGLTPREVEVLDLISRGYAYAEIARLKGLTLHTVQSHIKSLYGKLAVHSRSEAVFEASRMGLLPHMQTVR